MHPRGFHDPDGTFWPACDYLDSGRLVECGAASLWPADVFGYSFGGLVALAFAAQHPERIRRLVCCSTPIGATDEQIEARVAEDPASQAFDCNEDEASEADFERYLDFYLAQPASAAIRHWMRRWSRTGRRC